jgi:hypothetical protein
MWASSHWLMWASSHWLMWSSSSPPGLNWGLCCSILPFRSTWVHPLVLTGVCVAPSLVLCVCFVDRCLFFCPFSFDHCIVCPSIYGFWLPLWYLRFTDSDYLFGILDLRILITSLWYLQTVLKLCIDACKQSSSNIQNGYYRLFFILFFYAMKTYNKM